MLYKELLVLKLSDEGASKEHLKSKTCCSFFFYLIYSYCELLNFKDIAVQIAAGRQIMCDA